MPEDVTSKAIQLWQQEASYRWPVLVMGLQIQSALEEIIIEILTPSEKTIKYNGNLSPLVLMFMGVNGSGKTTTIAKIANNFIKEGKKVLLVAADTFRAAASEQLEEWSKKINTDILKGEEGSDPASIVFKSLEETKLKKYQVIIKSILKTVLDLILAYQAFN